MGSLRVGPDWAASLSLFTSCIGEGNGNPLQCSCLEDPRDGRAWWAAVYGVTQSQTRLKWLSSSSSSSLISMCLDVFLLGFILWDSLCLLDLINYFLFHVGEIFNYNLLKIFLVPFLFLLFFWDPYYLNVSAYELSERSLKLSSVLFILFTLFWSSEVISTFLSSSTLIRSSASGILLLIPSRVF